MRCESPGSGGALGERGGRCESPGSGGTPAETHCSLAAADSLSCSL